MMRHLLRRPSCSLGPKTTQNRCHHSGADNAWEMSMSHSWAGPLMQTGFETEHYLEPSSRRPCSQVHQYRQGRPIGYLMFGNLGVGHQVKHGNNGIVTCTIDVVSAPWLLCTPLGANMQASYASIASKCRIRIRDTEKRSTGHDPPCALRDL